MTTSGASGVWLRHRHPIGALSAWLTYLVTGFGMRGIRQLHFGETEPGLPQEFVDTLVGQVQAFAADICIEADAVHGASG